MEPDFLKRLRESQAKEKQLQKKRVDDQDSLIQQRAAERQRRTWRARLSRIFHSETLALWAAAIVGTWAVLSSTRDSEQARQKMGAEVDAMSSQASAMKDQVGTMREELTEMTRSGTDTHNLALAAKLDQRAWVGAAEEIIEPLKVGDVVHASVTYFNSGKTPATDVAPMAHQIFVTEPVSSEAQLLTLSKRGKSVQPTIAVMYQNIPYKSYLNGNDKIVESETPSADGLYGYVWGEVSYTDVFDETHRMDFCTYRKGISGDFLQCGFHNHAELEPLKRAAELNPSPASSMPVKRSLPTKDERP